jgi:pSer/pThr/pTyr-binding forkhead associated (FHA) protein
MRQMPRTEAESHHWPILEPLSGNRERPIALNKPVCVAGDRARVNLPLPSDIVSRAHALFLSDEHGIYVRDLASRNHLFINDEPVREAELHDGDRVTIGPYVFRCDGAQAEQANGVAHAPDSELRTLDGGTHVPLSQRSIVIGRREDCDVVVEGDLVSPAHAVIFELDGRHHIRDLRSRHGTFVNDKRIGQSDLSHGDQIRIGDAALIYDAATPAVKEGESEAGSSAAIAPESEEPPLDAETEEAAPSPAAPPQDLDIIPLMDDSAEMKAVASEFAQERTDKSEPARDEEKPAPPNDPHASESGIIPLLDDSEFAPGLKEMSEPQTSPSEDDDIPVGLALEEDDEPPQSVIGTPPAQKSGSRRGLPGTKHGKQPKRQEQKLRGSGEMKSRR